MTPNRLRDSYTTRISLLVVGALTAAGLIALVGAIQLDPATPTTTTSASWVELLLLCTVAILTVTLTTTWALAKHFYRPVHALAQSLRSQLPADTEDSSEFEVIDLAIRQMRERVIDAEDKVRRTKRLAEMGQYAAAIGHELRGPLTVIRGRAELLALSLDRPARAERLADKLQQDIDRMVDMLENLVDFAKVRKPRLEALDLGAMCNDILGELPVPPHITWTVRSEPFTPPAWVDPTQLRSAASNLIRNAIEAMPSGGELSVRISPSGDAGVRLEVSDQGVGMGPEVQQHLFEPLFTTKSAGTGLGLGIVRNFVQGNGGRITVDSTEGSGTTMTVELPAEQTPAPAWNATTH
jgi:signal transduction histidine kinase